MQKKTHNLNNIDNGQTQPMRTKRTLVEPDSLPVGNNISSKNSNAVQKMLVPMQYDYSNQRMRRGGVNPDDISYYDVEEAPINVVPQMSFPFFGQGRGREGVSPDKISMFPNNNKKLRTVKHINVPRRKGSINTDDMLLHMYGLNNGGLLYYYNNVQ